LGVSAGDIAAVEREHGVDAYGAFRVVGADPAE